MSGLFSNDVSDELSVTAAFPENNPFGRVSLPIPCHTVLTFAVVVNGEQNSLVLHLENHGTKNYTLLSAAASYHDVNNHWRLASRRTEPKSDLTRCSSKIPRPSNTMSLLSLAPTSPLPSRCTASTCLSDKFYELTCSDFDHRKLA